MQEKTSFPIFWPPGRPRSAQRRTQTRFRVGFADARDECLREIRRLGGTDTIISTNVPLKRNGLPQGVEWGHKMADPGVAIYFKRNGKEMCFACDCWAHVQDNMHAINLTISALRGIARWGTGDMMEAAFRGFTALPAPGETSGWWKILGVTVNATPEMVKDAYRKLAKQHHPDTGGDREQFVQIQRAYEESGVK